MGRFRLPSLVLGLLLVFGTVAGAAEPVGEVLALVGACTSDGPGGHRMLAAGDKVMAGDTVAVPKDGRLKLRMADGSVLALAADSQLAVAAYSVDQAGRRSAGLDLARGLMRAVVSRMAQSSSFEVGTATAIAAVRSTDWFIENTPQMTRVGVLSGTVALTAKASGHAVDVTAGQGSRVDPGKDPIPARAWSKAEFDDYIARTAVP